MVHFISTHKLLTVFFFISIFFTVSLVNGLPEFEEFFFRNLILVTFGKRVQGDELLIDEIVSSPHRRPHSNNSLVFHYPIQNRIITYVELGSDTNVGYEISLGLKDEGGYLDGTVTALEPKNFNLKLMVYGLAKNEETENIGSVLMPELTYKSHVPKREEEENYLDAIENDEENVIRLGYRQPGDRLLFKERKSSGLSDTRSEHSVTFYYIDSKYITAALFTAIESSTNAAISYSHMTQHSLKAVVTDHNVFELNASIEIFGFDPEDKPDTYVPPFEDGVFDPNLEGVKLQSLNDDVEILAEEIGEVILAPENLEKTCSSVSKISLSAGLIFILSIYLTFF